MKKGFFITFEGIDGSGKTSQLKMSENYLKNLGYDTVITREPGALELGEKIRSILLDFKGNVSDKCEMFLFLADRAQHVETFIIPLLEQGKIVLCDRYVDSTIAYQGFARGEDVNLLNQLNSIAINNLMPDLTLLYDLSTKTSQKRIGNQKDRMESAGIEFHEKVRNGYLSLQKENPKRIKLINAENNIDEVFENTKIAINNLLKEKAGK